MSALHGFLSFVAGANEDWRCQDTPIAGLTLNSQPTTLNYGLTLNSQPTTLNH
jgi:hypothetical protein